MNYFRYPFLFTFPFDFWCLRAVTARPITTFFKSALQFFYINHCMHGSAMQVVIGHIAFQGEMANFDLSYLRHR
jgi:hypothetical protein